MAAALVSSIQLKLRKLEGEFGPAELLPWIPVIVRDLAQELSFNPDACIAILRERGFLSSRPRCVVDLGKIPDGLNAKETERFLRENGAGICGQ